MHTPSVSIVIVNYRVKYFLEQTIRSAKEALQGLQGEIIVIDNNSQDDSIAYVRRLHPDVIYVENRENLGFAKANNLGFEIAQGEYILILNPDTVIGRNTLHECIRQYQSHPDCGGIGVKMHDGNGNFLPESKRAFPTPWVSFCKIFGLSRLFPKSRVFAKYHLRFLSEQEVHPVDILSGAFIFVKTSRLLKVGGFSTDYFMYGEDIDLSYCLNQAGYQNYYIPTPIIHYKGESTQKDSYRYVKVFYEAMEIFFRKHYPHFSKIYGFTVFFAIRLRASMALANRFFRKFFCGTGKKKQTSRPVSTIVVTKSEDAPKIAGGEVLASVSSIAGLRNEYPTTVRIIFDNRACSYQEIIEYIASHHAPNVEFAIYSSQCDIVITPKMEK